MLCNQCFRDQNGDGLSTLQWLTGRPFAEVLELAAKHLGIEPKRRSKTKDPAEHLRWLKPNDVLARLWCIKKPPIVIGAIAAVGGRLAVYREKFTVIATPVWGERLRDADPVGWVMHRTSGGTLPRYTGDEISWVKVKLTAGSSPGVICSSDAFDKSDGGDDPVIWKTEGPTDLMALLSAKPKIKAFTTANGAGEKPAAWMVRLCEGRDVNVVHDADRPGQDGATEVPQRDGKTRQGWCPMLAAGGATVRNVTLPFEVEPTHGPDLRDFFAGGGTMPHLIERAEKAKTWSKTDEAPTIEEDEDDPQRLARINLERYRTTHDGRLIFWRDEWWKWRDGRYRKIDLGELKAKVWASIRTEFEVCYRERVAKGSSKPIRKVTRGLVSNVVGAMESERGIASSVPMPCWLPDRSTPHYVATSNGLLDLEAVFADKPAEECLLPHSPDWFSAFRLDYPFNVEAECPKWLKFLDYSLEGDTQRIALLQEWAGYLLTSSNDFQRFLVLEGEGRNGKTVYFAAMTAMLGEDNVSHVSIENFDGRFELGTTIGKAANISGDAGEIDSVAEGVLKQFTGGDIMQFDRKNLQPVSARPTAKLMAAWNSRPRIRDKSQGLWRRMMLVPFQRKVEAHRRVLGMDKPQWWIDSGEAPGILLWAIAGLHRLRQNNEFSDSDVVTAAMAEYRQESNPAAEFFADYLIVSPQGGIESGSLYDMYDHWCRRNGCKPLGSRTFGKELRRHYDVDRQQFRDGRRRLWKYVGVQFSTDEIAGKKIEDEDSLF